ncbi:hypothetical protein DV515_00004310 [Chloebia gouldiae]|uniref:Uncharacterized protein n=1 Tax=Chloebia gouldiae TaxID=44316 RepID=A0A3L8SS04_CHLGU|nr:hypothetical protein DV515_00004310 [Chloebia gouldiae]
MSSGKPGGSKDAAKAPVPQLQYQAPGGTSTRKDSQEPSGGGHAVGTGRVMGGPAEEASREWRSAARNR